ncbi:substrate-binding domain-containing protein [Streptomyces hoynatensis]|uniref:DeoR family transcriptional regulator n=1 Tax=Streptomyces hoynatensis TaxID=1141874 RepID=A0A3A9YSH0_9ACTN|nr:substrate-binding domain-containing protein [Streptomyces hoynatensis]RKN39012.1 DeoR family transcriptional regulator [Streptomyces hoynatensis]
MADLLAAQRHELLVRELEAAGVLRISELAARFGVSGATIRRDLADLELAGRVTRLRGGAMAVTPARRAEGAARTGEGPAEGTAPGPEAPPAPGGTPAVAHTLGLLVPSATYYYPRVIAGVRAVAERRGARIVIGLTGYASPSDRRQVDELAAAGVSGLLVASAEGHWVSAPMLDRLRESRLPFVLLERQPRDPYEPCEFVVSDHRQGAFGAVAHLAGLGHGRVGLFTNGSPTAALVREGHAAAVERLGLDAAAPVVDSGRPTLGSDEAAEHYDAFLDGCLATGTGAALVHSDHDAIEMMRRLRGRGLHTPEDLALIAYDDELASLAEVPLTAVAPAKHELGEQAAGLLLDRLDAADPPALRRLHVQPRLIVRSSCGASLRA